MTEKIRVKDITPVKVEKPADALTKPNYSARNRIYVRAVQGTYETIRRFFGLIFLGIFAIIPWFEYQGQQAVLLNIVEQRFNFFAITLWPQDLTILAYTLIVSAFALFFITTFAGRVWCGFMCPQTTWTFIFIWFEEKIEGSRNKRMKLDQRAMDADKFIRKSLKHFAWVAVALLTALTFVGYFTPIDELFINFFTFDTGFWLAFWVLFFTFCTYANAGYMREIMCTHMCPYARFQSAISFTSEHELKGGTTKIFRSKLVGYALVLSIMSGLLVYDVVSRVPLEVDIIRDRNSLDRETNEGLIENVYTLKILNKSQQQRSYIIGVEGLVDHQYFGDREVQVAGGEVYTLPISVATDPGNLEVGTQKIQFHVSTTDENGKVIKVEESSTFIFTGV